MVSRLEKVTRRLHASLSTEPIGSSSQPQPLPESRNRQPLTGQQSRRKRRPSRYTPVNEATLVERLRRYNTFAAGAIPVLVTDPDMFHCSVCHAPLSTPIFVCDDGHTSCFSCRIRSRNKCLSCCVPNGFTNCPRMDKLIESMQFECKNKRYGCKETMMIHQKAEHENTCLYTLCFCPIPSCNFARSAYLLYNHFDRHHSSFATAFTYNTVFYLYVERIQKHILLMKHNEKVIFILNHSIQENGRVFNVDCIGPDSFKNAFVYRLTVKSMERCYSMEVIPEMCTKWEQHIPHNDFLTIPSSISEFSLEVCIKKAHPVE